MKKILTIGVTLLACGVLLAPAISQAKIGILIHDHGAPGKYDTTQDPYLNHDDNAYYGIKQFLRHLIMMKVIPNIVLCGDLLGEDPGACDGSTYYAPTDYYQGPYFAEQTCVGGSLAGLYCYEDADCPGGACGVSLNLIDSTSTSTDQGSGDAFLTDSSQDFSSYKDGNHIILSGTFSSGKQGRWWGFIGTEPVGDPTTVYIYNDPGRTTRGWCGDGATPNSNTKRYWLREDPTPFMDVWGDPPSAAGVSYADLTFFHKDSHYGEHYRLYMGTCIENGGGSGGDFCASDDDCTSPDTCSRGTGPGYSPYPSGPDKNFDEWGGFNFYYGWEGEMGGYEPYFFQNYPQMSSIRDTIWANYGSLLQGGGTDTKEDLIRLTQGIDYQFNEDPTAGVCEENGGGSGGDPCTGDGDCASLDTCDLTVMPGHGQSLYDGVIDLIDNVGVDKIIIAEHFVGHSRMMNEDMGRMSAQHALEDSTDPSIPIIYAPDRILVGEADYWRVEADYTLNYITGGHYNKSITWTGPTYVAGNFFNPTLSNCLAANAASEIDHLINDAGADDIAVFLSGHGTSNTNSGAYDSVTDTPHFNTKVWFISSVRKIVTELGGDPATVSFGPDAVTAGEVSDPNWYRTLNDDGTSGMDIISRNIKYATVTIGPTNYKFYRVYGQNGYSEQGTTLGTCEVGGDPCNYDSDCTTGTCNVNCFKEDPNGPDHQCGPDPHDLVYSAREALREVAGCAADLDCNNKVGLPDLVTMKTEFGRTDCNVNPPCDADINCSDGKVSLTDLVIMKDEFGTDNCPDCNNITDVLDHLRAFFGDSNDLLSAHRVEGYGEAFGYCHAAANDPDLDICNDQKLLFDLADKFPNPGMHETADIHHVDNFPNPIEPWLTKCQEGTGTPSYDPATWVPGQGVYDEVHQFGADCYRSNFCYKDVKVHITNATYCFAEKQQAVEENISAALDDATADNVVGDGDDVVWDDDNCATVYNPNQEDGDCDGIGDACATSTDCTAGVDCDDDCDGVANQNDNCQYFWNPSQADNDSDGIGNACDQNTDTDGDGWGDPSAYENTCNRMWMQMMMPMGMDMCDNCPDDYNPTQLDTDKDGLGDACDPN